MSDIVAQTPRLPAMSEESVAKVRSLESVILPLPQESITTHHLIHGGMYARTILIPAGAIITGCLVKIPTILITNGDVKIYAGDDVLLLSGHNVLPGSIGRKCAFAAQSDTSLTMLFPTTVKTVGEAEKQFTDEWELLASHKNENSIVITEE